MEQTQREEPRLSRPKGTKKKSFAKKQVKLKKATLDKIRDHMKPMFLARFFTKLYFERKLFVIAAIHFIATMVVYFHFFLEKFHLQKTMVPVGAAFYWWKRMAPSLEFGAMHAILFQMAIIPATMSRLTIARASNTVLNNFIPFNRAQKIHIHLGYTWATIVVIATAFFFLFFGKLCAGGEQAFCDKFKSEIFITGLAIVTACVVIAITSFLRNAMPYEVFYIIHHLVFIMYALSVIHTLDGDKGRKDMSSRSQTFTWFSAPLLYYICDRLAMHMNNNYATSVMESKLIGENTGTRMITMKICRPTLFQFKAGQYTFIKVSNIDPHWHPFSIASCPNNHDYLEFYIEVQEEHSWTDRLWNMLGWESQAATDKARSSSGDNRVLYRKWSSGEIKVEVMGPYGTSLGHVHNYSHAIVVGSGTGIVPVVSMFKGHIRQLLRLSPDAYFQEEDANNELIRKVEKAKIAIRGSFWSKVLGREAQAQSNVSKADSFKDLKKMKAAARKASAPIYGVVLLCLLPALGVLINSLTLSWNALPFELYDGMTETLQVGTIFFQVMYALISTGFWDCNSLIVYVDFAMIIISGFVDWFWFERHKWGKFETDDIFFYILLHGYMTIRLWYSSVKPRHQSSRSTVTDDSALLDNLHFIWVTRSATNVLQIAPDLVDQYDKLITAWGRENAAKVCKISIFITDRDGESCSQLKRELSNTSLHKSGCFHFERPNFPQILEDHAIKRINDELDDKQTSYSLLAFCGSTHLSSVISEAKLGIDVVTTMVGQKVNMDYVAENYGDFRRVKKVVE